jgi:hypothetical protein
MPIAAKAAEPRLVTRADQPNFRSKPGRMRTPTTAVIRIRVNGQRGAVTLRRSAV